MKHKIVLIICNKSTRGLTFYYSKQDEIEAFILLGDRVEEFENYRKPDSSDFDRRRSEFAGSRSL